MNSISFHFNDIFALSCLIASVVLLIKPKLFEKVIAILLLVYGVVQVIQIH